MDVPFDPMNMHSDKLASAAYLTHLIITKCDDVIHSTPLIVAAREGHRDAEELLLQYQCNIEAKTKFWSHTPLLIASLLGH